MTSTTLFLLPPPSDWNNKSEIVCGLSGYPYTKTVESAGNGYQNLAKRRRTGYVEEEEKKEEIIEDVSKDDVAKFSSHKKHKKALEAGIEDPYEIMGLEGKRWRATDDDIRTQYRKLVLLYHPDKMESKTEADDEIFKKISKANDTLTDPKKRRALDSQDDFDDSIPTGQEKGDFFAVFAPVFERFSRWSSAQPVPTLGAAEDDWDKVSSFYEFWYSFKSWRDFSFEDEYNVDDAESREEKRWMERQNERERKKFKKAEIANIFKLAEIAERTDPRVKRRKQEAVDAKKQAKLAKGDGKRKIQEEKDKAEAAERDRIKEEERIKAEEADKKLKDKAELAKKLSTARRKLRSLTKRFAEANPSAAFNPDADEIEVLSNKSTLEKLLEINALLLANDPNAVTVFHDEFVALSGKPLTPATSPSPVSKEVVPEVESPKPSPVAARPWTEDELALLSKALHRYPGGALNRWENIADMMGRTRSVKDIIAKTKDGKQVAKPADLYQAEDAFTRFKTTKKKIDYEVEPSIDNSKVDTPSSSSSSKSSSSTPAPAAVVTEEIIMMSPSAPKKKAKKPAKSAAKPAETPKVNTPAEKPVEKQAEKPVETPKVEVPAKSTNAPSKSTNAPSKSTNAAPSKSAATTPTKKTDAPAKTTEAPAKTTEAPVKANGTAPVKANNVNAPAKSNGTAPVKANGTTPAQANGNAKTNGTPAKNTATPAKNTTAPASNNVDTSKANGSAQPAKKAEAPAPVKAAATPAPVVEEKELTGKWSTEDQKALEKALAAIPAGVDERWDKVAAAVPGKTKKEVIARYKYLVAKIKLSK